MARSHPDLHMTGNREHWMLHEFKRKYHLYAAYPPPDDGLFEWLAIMQHHGAPTRLLDFTRSLFIAAYFAVIESPGDACVWALNTWQLHEFLWTNFKIGGGPSGGVLRDDRNLLYIDAASGFIGRSQKKQHKIVLPLEPKHLTERGSRQQGLFIMPTNASASFMDNLYSAFGTEGAATSTWRNLAFSEVLRSASVEFEDVPYSVIKFILPKNLHRRVLRDLQVMNIGYESLFPGLDGLAKSLREKVPLL